MYYFFCDMFESEVFVSTNGFQRLSPSHKVCKNVSLCFETTSRVKADL